MLPSSPSKNGASPYTAQQQQQQQQHSEADMDTSISNSTPVSPSRLSSSNSSATATTTTYSHSQSHRQQSINSSNHSSSTNTSGYLSPLSIQHSNIPQIRSPLAMGFSAQSGSTNGSIAAAASTLISRTGYNTTTTTNNTSGTRARDRRDSFQSPVAFSPTLSHSSPGVGGLTFQAGANSIYAHPPRFAHLWSGANTATDVSNGNSTSNRNRCLSTSSVDSNASSVGLSHLTPALAAMSVHHQQASPANSPYQSYSSSPHHNSFQHPYQQQQQQSSASYPPYHTAFSSSLQQQTQVPAYDSLSVAASNIASSIYGSTPPIHSGSDMMYNSSSQYAQMSGAAAASAQTYNSTAQRYGSTMLPLGPSLYSDQDSSRMTQPSQQTFDSASPLGATTRTSTARTTTFDYNEQQYDPSSSHGQYYGQSQQGLGIMVTGGMARSSSPDHTGLDGSNDLQSSSDMMGGLVSAAKLGMKRNNSISSSLQTPDDIHAVLGKDGKTLVYLCPKCDPSKEFTTKSNLKRHLENKNIHNTPYERRRDQKRWQGHEKKQVSRDETTLRMRKWRSSNPEKNRFNDMRCRVYKLARIRYGEQYSASKEEFIASEIERRKQLMIIRNSRRVDWANQASGGGDGSESPSSSPVPTSSSAASAGFSMSSDFTFGYEADPTSGQMITAHHSQQQQQIPAYGSNSGSDSMTQESSSNNKEEKTGPKDAQFLQDLIQNKLPPRRRSRSAMHSQMNNGSDADAAIAAANALSFPASSQSNAYGHNDSSLMSSPFGYSATSNAQVPASPRQVRRLRKQRSTTENSDHHQQLRHHQFSLGGTSAPNAFGGYPSVLGGSSYGGGSYMDSNEQLQMLEQKYYTGSISQTLGMATKSSTSGANGGKTQETLESVVEGMEIGQSLGPLDSATTTNTNNNATTNAGSGLYSDRDTSAWFATTTYNDTNTTASTADDVSRGFPFPTIRDRKELARAAGIRLDIPSQQALGGTGWINGLNGSSHHNNGAGPGSDDRVGGSATSPESAAARSRHDFSPLSGSATGYGVHSSSQSPMLAPALTNNNKHTKGSNMEVFGLQTGPMHLYGQGLGAPENNFFGTDPSAVAANNYMVKEQPVGRRHSTHLSNLSM